MSRGRADRTVGTDRGRSVTRTAYDRFGPFDDSMAARGVPDGTRGSGPDGEGNH
jgi:hypothetical protein